MVASSGSTLPDPDPALRCPAGLTPITRPPEQAVPEIRPKAHDGELTSAS